MRIDSLGVGVLGAGPVTQAIHVPTLATLPEKFHIVSVMDIDAGLADQVAARCNARSTNDARSVIEDPAVDVIAVCSPNALHASQVVAACMAGKRAVLCEKPLAVSHNEAEEIAAAASASGTHVVVGAMHVYDPAYRAARQAWADTGDTAALTISKIFLPSNEVFIDQATQSAPSGGAPPPTSPTTDRAKLHDGILSLAIHNIPLIRQFHPDPGRLVKARWLQPYGYEVVVDSHGTGIELLAYMGGTWEPDWTLRVVGAAHELRISFPPSYVTAGSSRSELVGRDSATAFQFDRNGYQCQWEALHDTAAGGGEPIVSVREVVDDLIYALDLASQVDGLSGTGT